MDRRDQALNSKKAKQTQREYGAALDQAVSSELEEESAIMSKKHEFRITTPVVVTTLVGIVIATVISIFFYLSNRDESCQSCV